MFHPKFNISNKLIANIKQITEIVTYLNEKRFPQIILLELEREAREISTYASTSIEGNPLPLTDVKQLLKRTPENIRQTEQEVVNYNEALVWLKDKSKSLQQFTIPFISHIHKKVVHKLLPEFSCGVFRQEPVFVNDPRKQQTIYWPPDYKDVPQLMADLITYIHEQKGIVDPLILAGLFHKQFVLIHPFLDGNGRTARLATKILLAGIGVDTFHLFSFERYYNNNVTKYFEAVGEYGNYYDLEVDFTKWLEYFTEGVLDELVRVKKELEKVQKIPAIGLKSHHLIILEYLQKHGSITDHIYASLTDRAKATRVLDFSYLMEQGMIERHGKARATYYTLKP